MESSLLTKTFQLLDARNHKLTLIQIAADTELSEQWLSALSRRKIVDPGVSKIQKLYEYLTNTKLV